MADVLTIKDGGGTSRNIQTKDNTGGTPVAWTRITAVCSSDGATYMPSLDAAARAGFMKITDGTNSLPTMDAAARAGFQKITDGTNTMPTMDAVGRKGFVSITDGTNTMPTMDAVGRKGFVSITDGTNSMPTMDAVGRPGFVKITNGTQTMPTMDAAARPGFVTITDGTNSFPTADAVARALFSQITDGTTGPVAVKAASTGAQATDKALVTRPMMPTDGTNTQPVMDAVGRAGFQAITDGTTGPVAVKAASTAALATDKALVVRPMMPTDGTNTQPAMDAVGRPGYVKVTDGTNTLPTMDVAARAGFVTVTNGTQNMPTMDAVARPGFFKLTDGTNTMPTGDAIARSVFTQISDATTGPVFVTPASTAAIATNKGLVVSLHPTSPVTTNADQTVAAGTVATKAFLIGGQFLQWASNLALTTAQAAAIQVDQLGSQKVAVMPPGTPVYASDSTGNASATTATLTIPANKMGFLDGFDIDGLGATGGSAISVTVTGALGGTLTYKFGVPAGATVPVHQSFRFNPPIQASAVNTNLVVGVPSFGSGNTASSVNAYGHYV